MVSFMPRRCASEAAFTLITHAHHYCGLSCARSTSAHFTKARACHHVTDVWHFKTLFKHTSKKRRCSPNVEASMKMRPHDVMRVDIKKRYAPRRRPLGRSADGTASRHDAEHITGDSAFSTTPYFPRTPPRGAAHSMPPSLHAGQSQ